MSFLKKGSGVLSCPHCNTTMEDGWEVLLPNEQHQIVCSCCGETFTTFLFECEACVADNFLTSTTPVEPSQYSCHACGRGYATAEGNDEYSAI